MREKITKTGSFCYKKKRRCLWTGANGLMVVPGETRQFVKSKGIELISKETKEACDVYNELRGRKKIVAVLILSFFGKLEFLNSLEKTFLIFEGILGVIIGFYFGHRGIERAEKERDEALDEKIDAIDDKKNAQEIYKSIENILDTERNKFMMNIREIEWEKYIEKESRKGRRIEKHPFPWDIPEVERKPYHRKFLEIFNKEWIEKSEQSLEMAEGIKEPMFSPEEE
jgi:hypothetical protein